MKKLAGLVSSLALACALVFGCTGDKAQAQEPPQDPLTACLEAIFSVCFPTPQEEEVIPEEEAPGEEVTPAPEFAPPIPPAEIPPVGEEEMLPEEAPAEEATPEEELPLEVSPIGEEEALPEEETLTEELPLELPTEAP
jgi:hypothetical protein